METTWYNTARGFMETASCNMACRAGDLALACDGASPSAPRTRRRRRLRAGCGRRVTSSCMRRSQRRLAAKSQKNQVRVEDVVSFSASMKLTTTSRGNRRFASGGPDISPSSPPLRTTILLLLAIIGRAPMTLDALWRLSSARHCDVLTT